MTNGPTLRARLAVGFAVACLAGALAFWTRTRVTGFSDFDLMWFVGRAILHGADPFEAARHAYGYPRPMLYPLTAGVVALPFAVFPQWLAPALFTGAGFGLLAFGLTRTAWWPLVGLLSLPAVESAQLAQWSPFFAAIALFPVLSFLAVVKPTTAGASALAFLPGRARPERPVLIGLAVFAVTTLIAPTWIDHWVEALRTPTHYAPLVMRTGGFLLLFALLKWRRPEGRLLALLAIVPLSGMAYDALVLCVVPRSRREAMFLSFASLAAVPFSAVAQDEGAVFARATAHNAPIYLVCLYLPALIMVLRRPNRPNAISEPAAEYSAG